MFVWLLIFLTMFCSSNEFKFPVQIVSDTKNSHTWAFDIGGNFTCEPLKDCATYSWLMNYKNVQNEVIQISLHDIVEFLEKRRCAIDDHKSNQKVTLETRVACPNVIDVIYDYAYNDKDDDREQQVLEVSPDERDGFDDYEEGCSIEISHGVPNKLLESLLTYQIYDESITFRTNLHTLKSRQILHLTAHGNCCWKLYSKPGYSGEETFIEQGASTYPFFQPKSIKNVSC